MSFARFGSGGIEAAASLKTGVVEYATIVEAVMLSKSIYILVHEQGFLAISGLIVTEIFTRISLESAVFYISL